MLIIRILYRFITATALADERSEEEDDEEEDTLVQDEKNKATVDAARKALLQQQTPQVHLNGAPVSASGMEEQTAPRSRRKG